MPSFSANLRVFLDRKLSNQKKLFITDIGTKLHLQMDCSRAQAIERISDSLCSELSCLKQSQQSVESALELMASFFCLHEVPLITKQAEQLKAMLDSFFASKDSAHACDEPPTLLAQRQPRMHFEVVPNISSRFANAQDRYPCVCGQKDQYQGSIERCYRCGMACHIECCWPKDTDQLFECPYCFLKDCLPVREVKQVIFAGYLKAMRRDRVEYKMQFAVKQSGLKQGRNSFEVRCIRLNCLNRFELTWPENCTVSLNKHRIAEFKPLNANSPLHRRNDEQLRLDRNSLLSHDFNELSIDEKHPAGCSVDHHMLVILAADPVDYPLIEKYQSQRMAVGESKQLLKEYLDRGDQEVQLSQLSISLKCQFYHTRISLPARSRHCSSHYQPFDLKNFLISSTHSKNSVQKWKCPICKKRAYDLVVDDYLLTFTNHTATDVTFDANGDSHFRQASRDCPKLTPTHSIDLLADGLHFDQDVIEISESENEQHPAKHKRTYSQRNLALPTLSLKKPKLDTLNNPLAYLHNKIQIQLPQQTHPIVKTDQPSANPVDKAIEHIFGKLASAKQTDKPLATVVEHTLLRGKIKSDKAHAFKNMDSLLKRSSLAVVSPKKKVSLEEPESYVYPVTPTAPTVPTRPEPQPEQAPQPLPTPVPVQMPALVEMPAPVPVQMPAPVPVQMASPLPMSQPLQLPLPMPRHSSQEQEWRTRKFVGMGAGSRQKRMVTINIESDEEQNDEDKQARRLEFHQRELLKQKNELALANSPLTASDCLIFASLCAQLMGVQVS